MIWLEFYSKAFKSMNHYYFLDVKTLELQPGGCLIVLRFTTMSIQTQIKHAVILRARCENSVLV